MSWTREQVEQAVEAKGYKYFETGDFNVNIIGIRNSAPGNKVTNLFDDWLTISYKEGGVWKFFCWAATTDPGKAPMVTGNTIGGIARVVPGQYSGSHMIRLHQGKYEALGQKGVIKLYRDNDRDQEYDVDVIKDCANCGINIHKAGQDSTWVERWSEGCQVFKRVKDFDEFMKICKKASKIHGNSFTYTLIESKDIK